MPEFRKDPVTNRWVIVATDRAGRPRPVEHPCLKPTELDECPFCAGAEGDTPDETLAFRRPTSGPQQAGWWVRVVPNKYPALRPDTADHTESICGLHDSMPGFGFHEILVESPHHRHTLDRLPINQVEEVLWGLYHRVNHFREIEAIRHTLIFKNHGLEAGASREHPHTQIIAMPIVPELLCEELSGCLQHIDAQGNCLFCDMLHQELVDGRRIVYENDECVVFCPYASRAPYECWLVPRRHCSDFGRSHVDQMRGTADALQIAMQKIRTGLGDPSFNMMMHSAPYGLEPHLYHWHIELLPKTTRLAGFEWGSGCYINPLPPERGADFLRRIPAGVVPRAPLPDVYENVGWDARPFDGVHWSGDAVAFE